MILVDSSVWIDFFGSSPGRAGDELRRMIGNAESFVLTGVVVTEILQGLTRDASRIEHYLSQWEMIEPRGFRTYREAAAIFRLGRAKGLSLTTIDSLIAAIALEHRASVFTLDKDFSRIARLTGLCCIRCLLHDAKKEQSSGSYSGEQESFIVSRLTRTKGWRRSSSCRKRWRSTNPVYQGYQVRAVPVVDCCKFQAQATLGSDMPYYSLRPDLSFGNKKIDLGFGAQLPGNWRRDEQSSHA
jgi:predicted nucleic acid-binding protein